MWSELRDLREGIDLGTPPRSGAPVSLTVDGKPGWSLPGAMPAGSGPTVKVLCVDPKGRSLPIERRRIAMAP
jgi:formate dehydrogenase major subunit